MKIYNLIHEINRTRELPFCVQIICAYKTEEKAKGVLKEIATKTEMGENPHFHGMQPKRMFSDPTIPDLGNELTYEWDVDGVTYCTHYKIKETDLL